MCWPSEICRAGFRLWATSFQPLVKAWRSDFPVLSVCFTSPSYCPVPAVQHLCRQQPPRLRADLSQEQPDRGSGHLPRSKQALFLGANPAGDFSQCSFIIPKILGFLRIMLNWLCPCFIHAMTKPGWWHVCWQHGWLNVLSPLIRNSQKSSQSIFSWSAWVR